MAHATTPQDVTCIRHACHQWQALLRKTAAKVAGNGGVRPGPHLAETAAGRLGREFIHKSGEPAPQTGFYFCAECGGRQDASGPSDRLTASQDHYTEYRPIFEYQGMVGPECRHDGRRAAWVSQRALSKLAAELGLGDLPPGPISEDYMPESLSAIIDWTGERPTPTSARDKAVLPQLVVSHVVHLWCPRCRHGFSASYADHGKPVACPACKHRTKVEGPSSPEFKVVAQCGHCHARLRLSTTEVGATTKCLGCKKQIYLAFHQISQSGAWTPGVAALGEGVMSPSQPAPNQPAGP